MAQKKSGFRAISDDVVRARMGKTSQEWYSILDNWGMKEKGHTLAAKHLERQYGLSPWWAQYMVIRYEWQRGLRPKIHRNSIGGRIDYNG